MYGLGRFNTLRYNRGDVPVDEIQLVQVMVATVKALVGSGENVHLMESGAERAQGRVQGAAGAYAPEMAMEAMALAACAGKVVCTVEARMAAGFDARVAMVTWAWLAAGMGLVVDGAARLGADLWAGLDAGEARVLGVMGLGVNVPMRAVWGDVLVDAYVAPWPLGMEAAVFDVEMGPGQVLVVDSDGYSVTLDGVDVIERQAGAWLRLDRDVFDVRLEAVQGRVGDLRTELTYVTKWK